MTPAINPRARTREDRAGDPLDGLVNLFDLGIVLAVAFLLAALSSIDLAPTILQQNSDRSGSTQVPADSVIAKPGEQANTIELQPGEKVVGQGEPVGTVYRLDDGRTVIVRPDSAQPVPGEEGSTDRGSSSSDPDSGTTTTPGTTAPGTTAPDSTTPPSDDSGSSGGAEPAPPTTTPQPSTGAP